MSNIRHQDAINNFLKSLEIYPSSSISILCYKYIGIAYIDNKQYDKAKPYLLKAKNLISEKGMGSELSSRLGWMYFMEKDYLEAKRYFEIALRTYKKRDLTNIESVKNNLHEINKFLKLKIENK